MACQMLFLSRGDPEVLLSPSPNSWMGMGRSDNPRSQEQKRWDLSRWNPDSRCGWQRVRGEEGRPGLSLCSLGHDYMGLELGLRSVPREELVARDQ